MAKDGLNISLQSFSSENIFANNNIATIYINQASNNEFHENNYNFISDNTQYYVVGFYPAEQPPLNYWDNGTAGNFWSDYNGTDANNDGIGDIPYGINAKAYSIHPDPWYSHQYDQTDHYPLIEPKVSPPPNWTPTPPTPTPLQSPSPSPSPSPTHSPSPSPTSTPTAPPSPSPSETPSPTPSASPSVSQAPTQSPQPQGGTLQTELIIATSAVAIAIVAVIVVVLKKRQKGSKSSSSIGSIS